MDNTPFLARDFMNALAQSTEKHTMSEIVEVLADKVAAKDVRLKVGGTKVWVAKDTDVAKFPETADEMLCALSCLKWSELGRYVLLKYNLIGLHLLPFSVEGDTFEHVFSGLLVQSRSVVLRWTGTEFVVASLPFARFRNLNECEGYMHSEVESRMSFAKTIEITDKMDGSFVQIAAVHDDEFPDGLLVSSSGSLLPDNPIVASARELIDPNIKQLVKSHSGITFIFEHIKPEIDPHVVHYGKDMEGLWLIGAREISSGWVIPRAVFPLMFNTAGGVRTGRWFTYTTLDEPLKICNEASARQREGFVVYIDGYMVKIKLKDFTKISKIVHGTIGYKQILMHVADNTYDDFISFAPADFRGDCDKLADELIEVDDLACEIIDKVAEEANEQVGRVNKIAYINKTLADTKLGLLCSYAIAKIDGKFSGTILHYRGRYLKEDVFKRLKEALL